MDIFKSAGLAAITMLALDGLWLGVIANKFYFNHLRHIARGDGTQFDVLYWAAGCVYIFMVAAFVLFVVPFLQSSSMLAAVGKSAVLGILIYGVYDFTNMATLKDWPVIVSIVDMVWGAFLFGVTAFVVKSVLS
jgi:uncharacterized membrane protein